MNNAKKIEIFFILLTTYNAFSATNTKIGRVKKTIEQPVFEEKNITQNKTKPSTQPVMVISKTKNSEQKNTSENQKNIQIVSAPITASTPRAAIKKTKLVIKQPEKTPTATTITLLNQKKEDSSGINNIGNVSSTTQKNFTQSANPPGTNNTIDDTTKNAIDDFFSVFPEVTGSNSLLPSLDKAINFIYQDTLHLSPVILEALRKLYGFIQSQVLDAKLVKEQEVINTLLQKIEIASSKNDPLLSTYRQQLLQAQNNYALQKSNLDSTIIKLCLESDFWQQYLQCLVAASFDYEQFLLSNVHEEEKQIFNFIPTFELSYYTDAFIGLRINSEIVRMFLIVTEMLRNRAINQSTNWKGLTDPSKLYDSIIAFKTTPLYTSQLSFTQATFGNKTFTIPSNITLVDSSGNIIAGFKDFLISVKDNNGKYIAIPHKNIERMLTVNPSTGNLSITNFGSLFLEFQPSSGSMGPSLKYTSMYNKLFKETPSGNFLPTPLYMTLIGFSGIKLLNNALEYLFNTANLESTMSLLATLKPSYFTDFPLIISYQPSDYPYLDNINFLKSGAVIKSNNTSTKEGTPQPQGGSIKKAFNTVGKGIKKAANVTGNGIATSAKRAGNGIANGVVNNANNFVNAMIEVEKRASQEFKKAANDIQGDFVDLGKNVAGMVSNVALAGVYYDTGLACLTEGISYSESQRKANKLVIKGINQLNNAVKESIDIIDRVGQTAKAVGHVVGSSVGQTVGFILGGGMISKDLSGALNAAFDAVIDVAVALHEFAILRTVVPLQLTAEAILFISQTMVNLVTAPFLETMGGTPFAGMGSLGENFLNEIVISILRPLKIAGNGLMAALNGIMQVTAYLAGAILDLVVNIGGGCAALAATTYGGDMTTAFNKIDTAVNNHRRVIISCISAVILTVIGLVGVPFTGGASVGLIVGASMAVIGAGMMAMMAVGENLQDEEAVINKAKQRDFLVAYAKFVDENALTTEATQNLLIEDVNNQFNDILRNQERSLIYYQNYINNSINSSVDISAYGIGNFYNQILKPHPTTGIPLADPGSSYGIQTNRLALNPSQGMTLYNIQRNTFAQEVASMPKQIIQDEKNNALEINDSPTQFWINQKDLSCIESGQELAAEIRWRTLNESQGAFYIGIFLSNQYIDTKALSDLYQNIDNLQSGKTEKDQITLQQAWENLNKVNNHILNINNKGKAFVLFREALTKNPTLGIYEHQGAGWINKNIAPISYQTGVWYRMKMQISSNSVAVKCWEDGQVEPSSWQGTFSVTLDPQFIYPLPITSSKNQISLTAPKASVMTANTGVGKYSYNASSNNWAPYQDTEQITQNKSQYAGSMGVITSGAAVEYEVIKPITKISISPQRQKVNALIDSEFKQKGLQPKAIDQEKAYMGALDEFNKAISFGSFSLTPISSALISQGIYLYTTNQTGLSGISNDYVVFAESIAKTTSDIGTAINLGIDPSKSPKAIVSLITGNAYDQNKQFIQSCSGVLSACQASLGIPEQIIQTIKTASKQYYTSLVSTLKFENITLTSELEAIQNNQYIYSGNSLNKNLVEKDYFVAASINQTTGLITPSSSYGQKIESNNNTINGLISLITGQVFTFMNANKIITNLAGQDLLKVSITSIKNAPIYSSLIENYTRSISSNLYQEMQQQIMLYQKNAITEKETTAATKPPTITPKPVSQATLPSLNSILNLPTLNDSSTYNINDAYDTGGL